MCVHLVKIIYPNEFFCRNIFSAQIMIIFLANHLCCVLHHTTVWMDGWMCAWICVPIAIKLNGCVLFFVEVVSLLCPSPISIAFNLHHFLLSIRTWPIPHFGFKMIFILLHGIFPEITKNNFCMMYTESLTKLSLRVESECGWKKGRKFTIECEYIFFSIKSARITATRWTFRLT